MTEQNLSSDEPRRVDEEMRAYAVERLERRHEGDDTRIHGLIIPPRALAQLEAMNERHAFVGYFGRARYLQIIAEPLYRERRYVMMERPALKGLYEGQTVTLMRSEFRQQEQRIEQVPIEKPLTWAWDNWAGRRTYTRVVFRPAAAQEGSLFNLWEGWGAEPKKGCWKRLLRHMYEVICRRDGAKFRWLIDWLSHVVQTTGDAGQRSPVSPVIWGSKGSGKSICFDYIAQIFGSHGMTVSRKDQLTGKFNQHLQLSVFVIAEEAVYAHDKQGEGPLKDLLTRRTLTIEPKGVDAYESPNFCRFVFVSNEKLAVPMTLDERRYQPFEVSTERVDDAQWFAEIVEEMQSGGLEAMFYDLKSRRYDRSLISRPLPNSDLHALKAEALLAPLRFVIHWFEAGRITLAKDWSTSTAPPARIAGMCNEGLDEDAQADRLILKDGNNRFPSAAIKKVYDQWCEENLGYYEKRSATRTTPLLVKEIRKAFPFVQSYGGAHRGLCLPNAREGLEEIRKNPIFKAYLDEIHDADEG